MQGKSTRTTMNRVSSRLQLDDLDESNHNNGKQKNLQTDSLWCSQSLNRTQQPMYRHVNFRLCMNANVNTTVISFSQVEVQRNRMLSWNCRELAYYIGLSSLYCHVNRVSFKFAFSRAMPQWVVHMYAFVGMFDRDQSGTIELHEFQGLWNYLSQWRTLFDQFDRDRSGTIDAGELNTGQLAL